MNDELPLPQELQHLIEKRSDLARRRTKRRTGAERRQCDLGPLGSLESAAGPAEMALEERRRRKQRRVIAGNRRKRPRRRSDPAPRGE
jgi:hypothetical protein